MRRDHLRHLVCPECRQDLEWGSVETGSDEVVETGSLRCAGCAAEYPVLRGVPRFVPAENYASGFGYQWNVHSRTQYDGSSGASLSETRFFEETRWPRDLSGERILEVGSGSGRFTEPAADTGATVISVDYSSAVDANHASNGHRENVLIVQGDAYKLPVRTGSFEKVLCIGVLQHTPDPHRTFQALTESLRPGGRLTVDVYRRHGWFKQLFVTKYWVRPFTRKMDPEKLYRRVDRYVRFMWPVTGLINRLPGGKAFNWQLLVADYRGVLDLDDAMLREWAVLDTFDMLNPAFDFPQTAETLRRWFEEAGLEEIDVHPGYNGFEGRGRRPENAAEARRG